MTSLVSYLTFRDGATSVGCFVEAFGLEIGTYRPGPTWPGDPSESNGRYAHWQRPRSPGSRHEAVQAVPSLCKILGRGDDDVGRSAQDVPDTGDA